MNGLYKCVKLYSGYDVLVDLHDNSDSELWYSCVELSYHLLSCISPYITSYLTIA